jgi:acyl carrier protein
MDKINKILEEVLNVSAVEAQENLGMDDVSDWDSLTHMNLIVAIEDEFTIEISGDDIAEMISFDAIRTTVQKYI